MSITVADLVAKLSLDGGGFSKGIDDAEKKTGSFGDKIGAAGTKMTAFATVPIVGFLGAATKAAAEDEAAQANLAKALENSVGATKGTIAAVEEHIGKMMKASTFTDDELRPAFRDLVTVTKDVGKAQDLMAIAMDVAAAKGIPLETATKAVAKASEGQLAAVNKLVPGMIDLKDENLSADEAVKKLAKTFSGQASAATETAAGKASMLKRDMGEVTESIGGALIPILNSLIGVIRPVVDWFANLSEGQQKIIVGVALAVAAIGPLIKIIQTVTTVIKALQVAMAFLAANPIVLVIAAIAAVIAILVLAYTKVEWFRNFVDAAFDAISGFVTGAMDVIVGAVKAVFNWVQDNWPLLLAILTGPIGVAVLLITQHWDTIKNAFTAVKDWIFARIGDIVGFFTALPGQLVAAAGAMFQFVIDKMTAAKDWIFQKIGEIVGFYLGLPGRILSAAGDLFGFLRDKMTAAKDWIFTKIGEIVGFYASLPGRILEAAGNLFGFLGEKMTAAKDKVIEMVQKIIDFIKDIPNKIGDVGGKILDKITPNIPGAGIVGKIPGLGGIGKLFGHGGPIGAGEVGIVGDRGPELFVPKTAGTIIPNNRIGSSGGMGIGGGGVTVVLNVGGSVLAQQDLVNMMYDGLKQVQRYRGNLLFTDR